MRRTYFANSRAAPVIPGPDIKLMFYDTSYETGFQYYELSGRVSNDDWQKIKQFFAYYTDPEEDTVEGRGLYGWLTTQPEDVEIALGVKPENTLGERKLAAKKKNEERQMKLKTFLSLLSEILEAFEGAEYPDPEIEEPDETEKYINGFEKIKVDGAHYDNPKFPPNVYGGGEWFVVQPEWIWFIRNNGMDGDDWTRNNVQTWGAGAIGVRIPYDENLEAKIKNLQRAFEETEI